MKAFTNLILLVAMVIAFADCEDRSKATLGGTSDTIAKAGTGDPNNTHAADSTKMDSSKTSKGNADPSGRIK
ncbi:hypothetical protein D0C36_24145 [Mucilaginibacter conchicola]|uniref:Uncharacterized protein n=1 Tax=Mucilaginibacter conchicola TaxID=2303333 RepID=A0A372NNE0_9SPHI|nr:hypothetical protein [Mucilaginibacter conchicola]RFZ89895.1 hypothetical protein D0C36_24145 [Mucilaginibacter conchicola]